MGIVKRRNKAAFIDRDGTLNKPIMKDGLPTSPLKTSDFKFTDGALYFCMTMKSLGYYVLVVTNQPDIARGNISKNELDFIHGIMLDSLFVDDVFVCPHSDEDNCICRKPKTGLIDIAVEKYNINTAASFVVGDTWRDMTLAKNSKCTGILINTSYNKDVKCGIRVPDLYEAVEEIVRRGKV